MSAITKFEKITTINNLPAFNACVIFITSRELNAEYDKIYAEFTKDMLHTTKNHELAIKAVLTVMVYKNII